MKSVRLILHHDADTVHPMHRFVADRDDFERYHLVHWNYAHDGRNVFLFHVIGDAAAYEAALEEVPEVLSADVTAQTDGSFYVYVREEPDELGVRIGAAFSRGTLAPIPPLEYRSDWTVRFTLVGEAADVEAAIDAVPDAVPVTVTAVGEYDGTTHPGASLTTRQRQAVRVARDLGYFAVPREATLEDVAAALECAPGTAAEHLRKAEETVMRSLEV